MEITWAKDPSVVFLAETLTDDARLEIVQRSIEHDHQWVVPREGRGGGFALFWKSSINLTVVGSSKYYIHSVINKDSYNEWRVMGFYGEPETTRRTEGWDQLRYLNSQSNIPWLCVGDFNEIIRQDEKVGGRIRPHNQMQLSNLGCNEIVEAVWHSSNTIESSGGILQRVEKCGRDLSWWNRNVFGNVWRELDKLRNLLLKAKGVAVLSGHNTRVRQLKKDIEVLRDREATIWAQRSRLLWARQGDKNLKYFHSCATKRYRKNLIEGVRDGDGNWNVHPKDIAQVFVSYFNTLCFSSGNNGFARVLELVPNVVIEEMNTSLSRAFDASEVQVNLQQMAPLKAPGPDGMPPLFYQHFGV